MKHAGNWAVENMGLALREEKQIGEAGQSISVSVIVMVM